MAGDVIGQALALIEISPVKVKAGEKRSPGLSDNAHVCFSEQTLRGLCRAETKREIAAKKCQKFKEHFIGGEDHRPGQRSIESVCFVMGLICRIDQCDSVKGVESSAGRGKQRSLCAASSPSPSNQRDSDSDQRERAGPKPGGKAEA